MQKNNLFDQNLLFIKHTYKFFAKVNEDIKNICCDKSEYQHMQKQIDSIRKDVVTGGYIKKAIKMISKEIERDKL